MYQIGLDTEIPYDKFATYLKEGSMIYVNKDMLEVAEIKLQAQVESRMKQLITALYGVTCKRHSSLSKYDIINYMIGYGVPERIFCAQGSYTPGSYNQKVRNKIIQGGYINDVFMLYEDYTKKNKQLTNIRNIISRSKSGITTEGNEDETLLPIDYRVEPTLNRRFSTKSENTIGFYGELRDSFSAPDDFYILSADFPQIDGKAALNMYMKNDHLDYLNQTVEDTYLVFKEYARYIQHLLDVKELESYNNAGYYVDRTELEDRIKNYKSSIIPFSAKPVRDIYKVTALKVAYYSRYSGIEQEQRTMRKLTNMYESSERYHRILHMATQMHNYNIPIEVSSRWGHSRFIFETDLRKTLSSVFNAPIQTTSSEAIIAYVVHFLDYFRNNGIGADDVRLCLNRHDEPIFYIRKAIYEEHITFIASMRTFLIEGWHPIKLDLYVGHSYKKNDRHAINLLERIPSTFPRALAESQKHKNIEEPYPLNEPMFVTVEGHKSENGVMQVAIIWQEGPLSKELSLDRNYVDRRKYSIKMFSFSTDEEFLNFHLTQSVINQFASMYKITKPIVVLSPNLPSEELMLPNCTAYFRSLPNSHELNLARGALVAGELAGRTDNLTDYQKHFLKYLEEHKHTFNT